MSIIVTGGAGFLGSRVIAALLARPQGLLPFRKQTQVPTDPRGTDAHQTRQAPEAPGPRTSSEEASLEIVSLDQADCPVADPRVRSVLGDVTDAELVNSLVTAETEAIFHLAAVLSGGSEGDFDLAMRVNVDGTRALLEAARRAGSRPRFVAASSLAVFGGAVPDVVPPEWATQPKSTYGATKAIGELLVNEYTRKGFVDGLVCRLPTISVRPGRPNSAASSFASGIIREPLAGEASACPVPLDTRLWLSSPDAAVANLVRALEAPGEAVGPWRVLNLPGLCVTAAEMLDALERVAGADVRALVALEPDERIMSIVCSWPGQFDVDAALRLGFTQDASFDDVVRQYRDETGASRGEHPATSS